MTIGRNKGCWSRLKSDFEGGCRLELDLKRANLKARPAAAINYNYKDGVLTCPQCARYLSIEDWRHGERRQHRI